MIRAGWRWKTKGVEGKGGEERGECVVHRRRKELRDSEGKVEGEGK